MDLLIELFSEEIPARMQARAREDLKKLVTDGLVDAGLTYASAGAFSTPRRLTLSVEGLSPTSQALREERKGPRTDAPEAALEGFLRSTGLRRDQLEQRDDKKAQVWFAVIEKPGRAADDIVAQVLDATIRNFPWPKSMRWGAGALRWVRPLHSIICLLSDEAGSRVVPLTVDGIKAGNTTQGHRFLSKGSFAVQGFDDYAVKLKRAFVVLDSAEREAAIWQGATNLAFAAGMEVVDDKRLLAEVAGLVEWPVPLMGTIGADFLHLPPEVLQTSMREHQKFFSVRNPKTGRIEGFVTVANTETTDHGATILKGNQKVLNARLSDARFFYDNDLRVAKADPANPMGEWLDGLQSVTFHNKLGSQADRVARIVALSREIAPLVGADAELAEQAARVAKADLRSAMVGEFPELQGLMGMYYARAAGMPEPVALAARDHWAPKGPEDAVPHEPVSVAVALAEKIDTLTGFWAIDEKPTGSKDPFALRRAALGVIRLVLENGVRSKLTTIFQTGFRLSFAFSGSSYGNHADVREMTFLEDSFCAVMEGLALKGAAIPFVLKSQQFQELQADIAGGFNWKTGKVGAEQRLARFFDRVKNSEYLELELVSIAANPEYLETYSGQAAETNALIRIFDGEMAPGLADLLAFFHDRLKVFLRDQGIRHDVIDACLAMPGNDDLTLLVHRARALAAFLKTDDGPNMLAGFKRATTILTQAETKDGVEYSYGADIKFAETDAERALFAALDTAESAITPAMKAEDFGAAMAAMARLRAPIDAFFDLAKNNPTARVDSDNPITRRNRLNLLSRIRTICGGVADLTKVEG